MGEIIHKVNVSHTGRNVAMQKTQVNLSASLLFRRGVLSSSADSGSDDNLPTGVDTELLLRRRRRGVEFVAIRG